MFGQLPFDILLCMLQDRQRPLWPVWVMMLPMIVGIVFCIVTCSDTIMPMLRIYLLLMGIGLLIYMVHEVRRYGRWLRDNYVDLEHKEVWQSFLVLAVILLVFSIYASGFVGVTYEYIVQVCGIVMICHLLWRVETLSDLTVSQLAQAIGTNRLYLGQYFARKNTTYNTYINNLRIQHFVGLYQEAVVTKRSFTAQQLASDSGYRSYSTFSLAFKQRMGQTVTAWMRELAES